MSEPQGVELPNNIWSNFDHEIDWEVEEQLREGGCYAKQPAWNYHGLVWFENGEFHEEVWVHNTKVETISASNIDALQDKVCGEYGYD